MIVCPSAASVERYVVGDLDPGDVGAILAHADRCPSCRALVEESAHDDALARELRLALLGDPSAGAPAGTAGTPALARYRILRPIGRGGMGRVFEAEQLHPRRRVALKVLSPGVVTPRLLRRFEFESEVLARLDHPGIARVFEAGTYAGADGEQPFFAMELVQGPTLSVFLRESRPARAVVLELFAAICDAVHHAHQKGVVHRDLKPSNVLVTADGRPKVLDFGVAAALDAEPRTAALETDAGAFVGTLPYMAPEVLSLGPRAADTQSDVYALGVLLYEMLAGAPPLDVAGFPLGRAARAVAEERPRPLGALRPELAGDLETIAAKALEKEPARRYSAAADLADDVRRHLRHEPIAARPLGAAPRAWRWARRNPALASAAGALALVLVAGTAAVATQAVRAARAERRALDERDASGRAAARATDALEFVKRAIATANPLRGGRGVAFTVREMLDEAAREIERDPPSDPELCASLHVTIGDAYSNLGQHEAARAQLERAVALRRTALGERHVAVAEALNALAVAICNAGDYQHAEPLWREAIEIYALEVAEDDLRLATTRWNLAVAALAGGELQRADELYALARAAYDVSGDAASRARLQVDVGTLRMQQGRPDEAEALLRAAHELARSVQDDRQPIEAIAARQLAHYLYSAGRPEEALPLYETAIRTFRRAYGDAHPDLFRPSSRVATLLQERSPSEAIEYFELALASQSVETDRDRRTRLALRNNLASALQQTGEDARAVAILRENLDAQLASLGERHESVAVAKNNLARVLAATGELDEAERLQSEALDVWTELRGAEHELTLRARARLGEIRAARDRR